MDILFGNPSVTNKASSLWPVVCDYTQLEKTLQRAAVRATNLGHPILASFTQPIVGCDPLEMFTTFQSLHIGDSFFWARPAEQHILIGTGTATTITTMGSDCIGTAATIWRDLQKHIVSGQASQIPPDSTSGPVLFGGFAFDPLNSHTPLWEGFPDGLLILPRLLFHCKEAHATLTINTMIQPETDIQEITQEICTTLQQLNTILEQRVVSPQETVVAQNPRQKISIHDLLQPTEWMAQIATPSR